MTPEQLERLAHELDSLTVIERAYAMQAYFIIKSAADFNQRAVGDFIRVLDKEQAVLAIAELPTN